MAKVITPDWDITAAEAERRVNIAAAQLAIRVPFIATIFSGMRREIDPDVPTACVRGMHVRFGPKFVGTLTAEELVFVAAHEAYHTALLHSYRVEDRDPWLWNHAGDAVINAELILAGLTFPRYDKLKLEAYPEAVLAGMKVGDPYGVLLDWVKPEANSEEVYQKLLKDEEKKKKGKPKGKPKGPKVKGGGQPGDGEPDPDGEPGDPNDPRGGWGNKGDLEKDDGKEGNGESEAEVKVLVTQAARTAFASGDKSAMIKRILGVVGQSEVDWKDETRSMLADPARNDYSYRRYSKRFLYSGTYLPSLYSEDMGVLGVGIDTSGSMTARQLAQIQAELRTIIEDCAPSKVIVVYCDAAINRVDTFHKGEELVLEMCGGGGTDMRVIVDYFDKCGEKLAGVIIFSDLETPFPTTEPDYPFLWGAVGARHNVKAPVGRVVEVRV